MFTKRKQKKIELVDQTCKRLLRHVHALDGLELLQEDWNGLHNDRAGPGQGFHHVGQGPGGVVHQVEVVFHFE